MAKQPIAPGSSWGSTLPGVPVTLRDVAAAAGVSLANASRALAGGRCAETTRARIQAVAAQLGWVPDVRLASLSQRRWRTSDSLALALMLHSDDANGRLDAAAMIAVGRRSGFAIHPHPITNRAPSPAELHRLGAVAVVCGLLAEPLPGLDELAHAFPAVALGSGGYRPCLPVVADDAWRRSRAVWDHLIGLGYRRIGIALANWPDSESALQRRSALRDAWLELDASERVPPLAYVPGQPHALVPWFRQERPHAVLVFAPTDLDPLLDAGVRIPEDTAAACLAIFEDHDRERFAGSWYDREAVALAAGRLLAAQVRGNLVGSTFGRVVEAIHMPVTGGLSAPPACRPPPTLNEPPHPHLCPAAPDATASAAR